MNYGAVLGVTLTGAMMLLALIALLLSLKKRKLLASRFFLERRNVIKTLNIFLVGMLMLTANMLIHAFNLLGLVSYNLYIVISITCGSGLAISLIITFCQYIRIVGIRRRAPSLKQSRKP